MTQTIQCRVVFGRQRDAQVAPRSPLPFAATDAPAASEPPVSRTARLLALGYKVRRLLDAGELPDQTEAAARLGLSIPHLSHVVALTYLSPRIQEAILGGQSAVGERALRPLAQMTSWGAQEAQLGG